MKRILALTLALIMVISVTSAFADETDITVYVSISKCGEVQLAYSPVTLSGQDTYNVDDVFREAHRLYCPYGIEGYASSVGSWGLSVDKLWGDTSYNFGYYLNGETKTIVLGDTVADGAYIDGVIYENAYPDTEGYSFFDVPQKDVDANEEFELTLMFASGYDENWNSVYSPCEDATITVDGKETELKTDENGKVLINSLQEGKHIISAYKKKVLNERSVPAITAPVCLVNISCDQVSKIVENIAKNYKESDLSEAGVNLPWIIADMMTYEEVFPQSENILSEDEKKNAAKLIVSGVEDSERAGDIAKAIIALSALGYDARNIVTRDYKNINLSERLTDLIKNRDESITNIYTLPYVIIALSQSDDYCADDDIEYLITSAVESKEAWYDTTYGTDAMTPMILALTPYYELNLEVKTAVDGAISTVKENQREDGLIDGPNDYEAASTGLAICALSAMGDDPTNVKNGGKSLVDGIMSVANEDFNGFTNAFSTEQGFRGLLGLKLMSFGKRVYDFSLYEKVKLNLSDGEYCPVIFKVSPKNAKVFVEGVDAIEKNIFDLDCGTYNYTVSAQGYNNKEGTIEVTMEEAEERELKSINVSLTKSYSSSGSSGGGSSYYPPADNGSNENKPETNEPTNKPDVAKNKFPDVLEEDWFSSAVEYVCEKNLFNGTEKGFEPNSPMTRAMLVTVLYRMAEPTNIFDNNPYVDIPEDEWFTESVKWATGREIVTGISTNEFAPNENITREQLATIIYRFANDAKYDVWVEEDFDLKDYNDYDEISDYAIDGMKYLVKIGVITGRTTTSIAPKGYATRAEVATMLMRFLEVCANA